MSLSLRALPLTAERFAPFGDVIEASAAHKQVMNNARFERFRDLARVDMGDESGAWPSISIARSSTATEFPYRLDMLERHPNGSQAFMPLAHFRFVVVVAPAGESVEVEEIAAFVTNGKQGVNYHKGVWHMPMIALRSGQEFLIVDSAEESAICDEHYLGEPVLVEL